MLSTKDMFSTPVFKAKTNMRTHVNRRRKLACSCDFGALTDESILGRLVVGIRDRDLKGRLLRQKGLLLQKALEMSKSNEGTKQQLKSLENEEKRNSMEEIHERKGRHKKPKKTFNQNTLKPRDSKVEPCRSNIKKNRWKRQNNFERKVQVYCGNQIHHETILNLARCVVSRCDKSHHSASVCNAKRIQ